MARAVGIDLGTTNSVGGDLEGGDPLVVANSEGSCTTPSVVAFAEKGEVLVGQPAKNQAVTNVDRTVRSVKREIGTDWHVAIDDKNYTAQENSARVMMPNVRPRRRPARSPGLNVLRIINEPTAAALAYGLDKGDKGDKEQTILVESPYFNRTDTTIRTGEIAPLFSR